MNDIGTGTGVSRGAQANIDRIARDSADGCAFKRYRVIASVT